MVEQARHVWKAKRVSIFEKIRSELEDLNPVNLLSVEVIILGMFKDPGFSRFSLLYMDRLKWR